MSPRGSAAYKVTSGNTMEMGIGNPESVVSDSVQRGYVTLLSLIPPSNQFRSGLALSMTGSGTDGHRLTVGNVVLHAVRIF